MPYYVSGSGKQVTRRDAKEGGAEKHHHPRSALARRMDPHATLDAAVYEVVGAAGDTFSARQQRRRWREATAPLRPEDYAAILHNLASSDDERGAQDCPADTKHSTCGSTVIVVGKVNSQHGASREQSPLSSTLSPPETRANQGNQIREPSPQPTIAVSHADDVRSRMPTRVVHVGNRTLPTSHLSSYYHVPSRAKGREAHGPFTMPPSTGEHDSLFRLVVDAASSSATPSGVQSPRSASTSRSERHRMLVDERTHYYCASIGATASSAVEKARRSCSPQADDGTQTAAPAFVDSAVGDEAIREEVTRLEPSEVCERKNPDDTVVILDLGRVADDDTPDDADSSARRQHEQRRPSPQHFDVTTQTPPRLDKNEQTIYHANPSRSSVGAREDSVDPVYRALEANYLCAGGLSLLGNVNAQTAGATASSMTAPCDSIVVETNHSLLPLAAAVPAEANSADSDIALVAVLPTSSADRTPQSAALLHPVDRAAFISVPPSASHLGMSSTNAHLGVSPTHSAMFSSPTHQQALLDESVRDEGPPLRFGTGAVGSGVSGMHMANNSVASLGDVTLIGATSTGAPPVPGNCRMVAAPPEFDKSIWSPNFISPLNTPPFLKLQAGGSTPLQPTPAELSSTSSHDELPVDPIKERLLTVTKTQDQIAHDTAMQKEPLAHLREHEPRSPSRPMPALVGVIVSPFQQQESPPAAGANTAKHRLDFVTSPIQTRPEDIECSPERNVPAHAVRPLPSLKSEGGGAQRPVAVVSLTLQDDSDIDSAASPEAASHSSARQIFTSIHEASPSGLHQPQLVSHRLSRAMSEGAASAVSGDSNHYLYLESQQEVEGMQHQRDIDRSALMEEDEAERVYLNLQDGDLQDTRVDGVATPHGSSNSVARVPSFRPMPSMSPDRGTRGTLPLTAVKEFEPFRTSSDHPDELNDGIEGTEGDPWDEEEQDFRAVSNYQRPMPSISVQHQRQQQDEGYLLGDDGVTDFGSRQFSRPLPLSKETDPFISSSETADVNKSTTAVPNNASPMQSHSSSSRIIEPLSGSSLSVDPIPFTAGTEPVGISAASPQDKPITSSTDTDTGAGSPKLNLVKRAKVVDIFTALTEYSGAARAYVAALKASRHKVPPEANDGVRGALTFATSLRRSLQDLSKAAQQEASIVSAIGRGSDGVVLPLFTPDALASNGEDQVYSALLSAVEEEIRAVHSKRDAQQHRLTKYTTLSSWLQQLAADIRTQTANAAYTDTSYSGSDLSPDKLLESIDALVQRSLAASWEDYALIAAQCQRAEALVCWLCDLQRIYPHAFLPRDAADTLVPFVLGRLLARPEHTALTAFPPGSVLRRHCRECAMQAALASRSNSSAPAFNQQQPPVAERAWALRETLVDYTESASCVLQSSSPPRANFSARSPLASHLPFVVSVTSQVHNLAPASEEAQIVKLCAESHRYCSLSAENYDSVAASDGYVSVLEFALDASSRLLALIDRYAVVAEEVYRKEEAAAHLRDDILAPTSPTKQRLLVVVYNTLSVVSSLDDGVTVAERRATAIARVLTEVVQSFVAPDANRIAKALEDLNSFLKKRMHLNALLKEELHFLRSIHQTPLSIDPAAVLHSERANSAVVSVNRGAVLNECFCSNNDVARANFLLLGNCLMSATPAAAPPRVTTDATEEEVMKATKQHETVQCLNAMLEAQEVLAAAVRRLMLSSPPEVEQQQRLGVLPMSSSLRNSVLFPPTSATSPELMIDLLGSKANVKMPAAKARALLSKIRLLQSPGIIAFYKNAELAATGVSAAQKQRRFATTRCVMTLHPDCTSLVFSNLKLASGESAIEATQSAAAASSVEPTEESSLFLPLPPLRFSDVEMLLQGPSSSSGVTALQSLRVVLTDGRPQSEDICFSSFASFMEWSEVLQFMVRWKQHMPNSTLKRLLMSGDECI